MPDLSSYINFGVQFDLTTGVPVMILEDTSNYPSGVDEDITGYFSITSPDDGTDSGSWSTPDVYWNGASLTSKQLILRLSSTGNIQHGNYTVTYNVDHPSYTPTVLSRTFNVLYVAPTLNLVKNFDVFTPSLKYYDQTAYQRPGFDIPIITREWEATSIPTGTITGSSAIFDLAFSSDYYDADYSTDFLVNLVYQHSTYDYLVVVDEISTSLTASADTPIEDLVIYLNDLKDELDSNINNDTLYKEYKSRYEYAASILFNIIQSCKSSIMAPLTRYMEEYLSIVNNFVYPPYTNTNQIIDPYVCDCESTTSSGLTIIDEFIVGDVGEMADGSTVYENAEITKKPIVFVDGIRMTYRSSYPGRYITYDPTFDRITFSSPVNAGEVVSIYV
jgi:hypothetical protein